MTRLSLLASLLLAIAACGTDADDSDRLCATSDLFQIGDDRFCVVTDEGFLGSDCPSDFPFGRAFDAVMVCGEIEPPDAARDELENRGLVGPACTDNPEAGIYYTRSDDACTVEATDCPADAMPFKDVCGCGCQPPPQCADGDTMRVDCNTCSCLSGSWSCTEMACECTGTQTRPHECNTECQCEGGFWQCPDVECSVEECLADCGDGCPAPEFQICGEDGLRYCNECTMACLGIAPANDLSRCDSLDNCLEDCGIGCPAPEFQICGEDGNLYCTICVINCHNVRAADDRAVCEGGECAPGDEYEGRCGPQFRCDDGQWRGPSTCDPGRCGQTCTDSGPSVCGEDGNNYDSDCWRRCFGVAAADPSNCDETESACDVSDEFTAVEWARFDVPGHCRIPEPAVWEFVDLAVVASEDDFNELFECDTETSSGVDWSSIRVAMTTFPERPYVNVLGAYQDGERVRVQLAAPMYCGGAAPPTTINIISLPADDAEVYQHHCTFGQCPDGPPPP